MIIGRKGTHTWWPAATVVPPRPCPICVGTGLVHRATLLRNDLRRFDAQACSLCRGVGQLWPETPSLYCPWCGNSDVHAEFVDIGVGQTQSSPYTCDCGSQQVDTEYLLTNPPEPSADDPTTVWGPRALERQFWWSAPPAEATLMERVGDALTVDLLRVTRPFTGRKNLPETRGAMETVARAVLLSYLREGYVLPSQVAIPSLGPESIFVSV